MHWTGLLWAPRLESRDTLASPSILEGYNEAAVDHVRDELIRWRQGRFYFEEGVISQVQSVDRPWPHLLIDNLQKLDETLQLVSVQ